MVKYQPVIGNAGYQRIMNQVGVCKYFEEEIKTKSIWKPDWRSKDQYPDPEKVNNIQWAWEFLRRNVNYQSDFAMLNEYYVYNELGFESKKESEQYIFELMLFVLCTRYSTTGMVSPEAPYSSSILSILGFISSRIPFTYFSDDPKLLIKDILPFSFEEITMKFHVGLPIKPQIERAKDILELKKKERKKYIDKDRRFRIILYQDYLRIYDAYQAGTSINEIAAVICPEIKNQYPEFVAKKRIEGNLKAAKELIGNGYKYIPFYFKYSKKKKV